MRGRIDGFAGRARFAALALPLIIVITATYHLGYPQYREDGVQRPEVGNTIISVPTLVTANPVGSVIAHRVHARRRRHARLRDADLPLA